MEPEVVAVYPGFPPPGGYRPVPPGAPLPPPSPYGGWGAPGHGAPGYGAQPGYGTPGFGAPRPGPGWNAPASGFRQAPPGQPLPPPRQYGGGYGGPPRPPAPRKSGGGALKAFGIIAGFVIVAFLAVAVLGLTEDTSRTDTATGEKVPFNFSPVLNKRGGTTKFIAPLLHSADGADGSGSAKDLRLMFKSQGIKGRDLTEKVNKSLRDGETVRQARTLLVLTTASKNGFVNSHVEMNSKGDEYKIIGRKAAEKL